MPPSGGPQSRTTTTTTTGAKIPEFNPSALLRRSPNHGRRMRGSRPNRVMRGTQRLTNPRRVAITHLIRIPHNLDAKRRNATPPYLIGVGAQKWPTCKAASLDPLATRGSPSPACYLIPCPARPRQTFDADKAPLWPSGASSSHAFKNSLACAIHRWRPSSGTALPAAARRIKVSRPTSEAPPLEPSATNAVLRTFQRANHPRHPGNTTESKNQGLRA